MAWLLLVVVFSILAPSRFLTTGALTAIVVTYWLAHSSTVVGVSGSLAQWTFLHQILTIPVQFYYCVLIMLIIWYVSRFTPIGLRALFVGQSGEVAVLNGIKTTRVRVGDVHPGRNRRGTGRRPVGRHHGFGRSVVGRRGDAVMRGTCRVRILGAPLAFDQR